MQSMHDLEILINAGHQLIVVETEREGCFVAGFERLAQHSPRAYFQWTITQGLLRLAEGYQAQTVNKDINQLFAQIHSTERAGVYVLVDFHHYIDEPVSIRHLKDVLLHSKQHCVILLAQKISLPEELEHLATRYKLPLPTQDQLQAMINELAVEYLEQTSTRLRADDRLMLECLMEHLCGLSLTDAKRMARHAIFNDGIIDQADIDQITHDKFELLNSANTLSLELDFAKLEDVAGMQNLRSWLRLREPIFNRRKQLPGGDIPRGILLLGVQGCGKSLAAKAVAGSWNVPLLRLDFGTLYNRFYGQTEENLRAALETATKMQPCVLWLDEIEKGMSAVSASDDVSKRMLATFLTWLAENKAHVFIVATANDVSALPPELMRKGRFDEIFFVDLPDASVREQILRLHLHKRDIECDGWQLSELVAQTNQFSGAELEQLVVAAMYERAATLEHPTKQYNKAVTSIGNGSESSAEPLSWDETETLTSLLRLANGTKPLAVVMHERIAALRSWASDRTVSA